jgi:large subunit ribosomal protein L33
MKSKTKAKTVMIACSTCHDRNYATPKSAQLLTARLEIKKYCPRCSIHTLHRETK